MICLGLTQSLTEADFYSVVYVSIYSVGLPQTKAHYKSSQMATRAQTYKNHTDN